MSLVYISDHEKLENPTPKFLLSLVITMINFEEKFLSPKLFEFCSKNHKLIEIVLVVGNFDQHSFPTFKNLSIKIVQDSKKGIYAAYNLGWKTASGKAICFINPSDNLEFDFELMQIIEDIERNPKVLYGDSKIVDDTQNLNWVIKGSESSNTINQIRMPSGHQAQIYPKIELEKLNGFSYTLKYMGLKISLKYASDHEFYCRSYISGTEWRYEKSILAVQELGGASSQHWLRTTAEILMITWKYGDRNPTQFSRLLRSLAGACRFHLPRQKMRKK